MRAIALEPRIAVGVKEEEDWQTRGAVRVDQRGDVTLEPAIVSAPTWGRP